MKTKANEAPLRGEAAWRAEKLRIAQSNEKACAKAQAERGARDRGDRGRAPRGRAPRLRGASDAAEALVFRATRRLTVSGRAGLYIVELCN